MSDGLKRIGKIEQYGTITVTWMYDNDGEFISNLKTQAFRDSGYLNWIRGHKCFACRTNGFPPYDRVTASHIFRGYHGLKNHDWGAVPMCGECHWSYEYHRDKYIERFGKEPTIEDANKLYLRYLQESNKQDTRTQEQMVPI